MWVYPSVIFVQEKVEKAVTLEGVGMFDMDLFFFVFFSFFSSTLFLLSLSTSSLSTTHTHTHTHIYRRNVYDKSYVYWCFRTRPLSWKFRIFYYPKNANLMDRPGKCQHQDTCTGTTKSGLCPGPSEYKCCLGSVPSPETSTSNTPTSSPSTERHHAPTRSRITTY